MRDRVSKKRRTLHRRESAEYIPRTRRHGDGECDVCELGERTQRGEKKKKERKKQQRRSRGPLGRAPRAGKTPATSVGWSNRRGRWIYRLFRATTAGFREIAEKAEVEAERRSVSRASCCETVRDWRRRTKPAEAPPRRSRRGTRTHEDGPVMPMIEEPPSPPPIRRTHQRFPPPRRPNARSDARGSTTDRLHAAHARARAASERASERTRSFFPLTRTRFHYVKQVCVARTPRTLSIH